MYRSGGERYYVALHIQLPSFLTLRPTPEMLLGFLVQHQTGQISAFP